MLNATFNNISVTDKSQLSVVLVEETRKPYNNYRPAANHCETVNTNTRKYFEVITTTVNLMGPSCPFEDLT